MTTPVPHQVVRASAGAGKTYQLTTRYLRLLERGDPIEDVLATTFTRKAAGEVLARVLGRLAGACQGGAGLDALRTDLGAGLSRDRSIAILRGLADHLHRLSVGTIDGFFNRAARAMAFDLDLPTDPRLIDEGSPLAKQMRTDAIHAALGEAVAGDAGLAPLIEMLRRLHHNTAQRSVTDAIDQIVVQLDEVYRAYPDKALWDALPDAGLLSQDLLTAALHTLESVSDQLPQTKKGEPNKTFKRAYGSLLDLSRRAQWDDVLKNGLVEKIGSGAPEFGRATIPEPIVQAVYPLFVHAKATRIRSLADQTRATHELLFLFDRHYRAQRHAHRVLLFSDLTHLLADGLKDADVDGLDELCYRLDARVTHLLLDEFQDTSLRQWDVLRPFADQIVATGDGSRSLFVVGDTKQAIYGWRGGCAELFDAVEQLPGIDDAARVYLRDSWRSSQIVLDAVNTVFDTLTTNSALEVCSDAAAAWQARYRPHRAKRDLSGYVVLQTTARADNTDDADDHDALEQAPADAHARYVALHIQAMAEQIPGRSIGVLVRRRESARRVMHELRSLGVPAAEEGGNPIDSVPAVSAALSAIQLADHPGDSVARFHVLNTPIGAVIGITPGQHATQHVAVARSIRRDLIDRGYAKVLADWAHRLAPSCDARSLRRLTQLVELAEHFDEHDAGLRPAEFVAAVRAAKVEDPAPGVVRVMTAHASKGLEFDAVVLPDLDQGLWRSDARDLVVLDRDSPIDPVRAIYRRADQKTMALLPELEEALQQRTHEKRTEDLCLLYVAMTRARHALHLLVRPLAQNQKTGKRSKAGLTDLSYSAILRQALCPETDEGFDGDEILFASGDPRWHQADAPTATGVADAPLKMSEPIRLARSAGAAGRTWTPTAPSAMQGGGRVSVEDLLRTSPNEGRAYGTAMHALLACVGFIDETEPDLNEIQSTLARHGAPSLDHGLMLAAFEKAIQHKPIREQLCRQGASVLWRERPFAVRVGRRLVRGVFDRVQMWGESSNPTRVLLLDFKTDRVDQQTADHTAGNYADQISLYREALATLLGVDRDVIEAKLLFVGDGIVVQVP